jgi:glycosyltransferase involved in cell wall biosynthesis
MAYIAPANDGTGRMARFRKHWWDFCNDWLVFRLLRTRQYSLIQIKDKYLGALIAIAAARVHGVPVFYWLAYPHGEASSYAAQQGIARYALFYALRGRVQRWLLYRVIMPACAHVFVQSEQMRDDVALEGIPRSKLTPVPSAINLADVDEAMAQAPRSGHPEGQRIVYLGTLLRERRLDLLIRAFALVRKRVADAELVFVGRGETPEDEAVLWREAKQLGVAAGVTITGWLPTPVAWNAVQAAAVCVSPYYPTAILRSTSPTKLIEYLALGKAVVANTHPEQTAVIQCSGGGLLCDWSETEFADTIVYLLRHRSIAEAMGGAGRRFVERERTHIVMVGLVTATYRDVLSRWPAAAASRSQATTAARFGARSARRSTDGWQTDD